MRSALGRSQDDWTPEWDQSCDTVPLQADLDYWPISIDLHLRNIERLVTFTHADRPGSG